MTVYTSLLVKILLGVVAVVFCWFAVGEMFSQEDTDQLLASATLGFSLAAVIFP